MDDRWMIEILKHLIVAQDKHKLDLMEIEALSLAIEKLTTLQTDNSGLKDCLFTRDAYIEELQAEIALLKKKLEYHEGDGKCKCGLPRWRSMMYKLLSNNFQSTHNSEGSIFVFNRDDVSSLEIIKNTQCKGEENPPFDYSDEVAQSFGKIIDKIHKTGEAIVRCCW